MTIEKLLLRKNQNYDNKETKVIYSMGNEELPSLGVRPDMCPHPAPYHVYYESNGALGHGWYCILCGQIQQVG